MISFLRLTFFATLMTWCASTSAQDILLEELFDDSTLGAFTAYSVLGDNQNWEARDFGGKFFVQMNGFDGGIQDNPNLDNILEQRGRPDQINLNGRDRQDIIAFLNTLTDENFLTDPKFSDPFVTPAPTFGSSR